MFIIIWLVPVLRKWRVALEVAWMIFIENILWNDVSHTLTLNFHVSNSLWHLSCFYWPANSYLYFERKMNSKKLRLSLKWRRTPFPFLVAEVQLKSKLHLAKKDLFIYLSFVDYFLDNIYLKTGSLMNAYERELKLSNHYNENVSENCNLTYLQSFLSQ